jgi:hypothetical protein
MLGWCTPLIRDSSDWVVPVSNVDDMLERLLSCMGYRLEVAAGQSRVTCAVRRNAHGTSTVSSQRT